MMANDNIDPNRKGKLHYKIRFFQKILWFFIATFQEFLQFLGNFNKYYRIFNNYKAVGLK